MDDYSVVFESDMHRVYPSDKKQGFVTIISNLLVRIKLTKNENQSKKIILVVSLIFLILSLIMFVRQISKKSIPQPSLEVINTRQPLGPIN